jgi:hypothetical protein
MPVKMIVVRAESESPRGFNVWEEIVDEKCLRGSQPMLAAGDFVNLTPGLGSFGRIAVGTAFEVPEKRVSAQEVVAMNVVRVAEQIEREPGRQFLDDRNRRLVRLKDILPRIDERGLGSPIFEDIENAAEKRASIDLPVFVGNFDAVDQTERFNFIFHVTLSCDSAQGFREIELQENVADIEKKGADGHGRQMMRAFSPRQRRIVQPGDEPSTNP